MLITLNDLRKKPCRRYSYLYDYGISEFNPIEEINKNKDNDRILADIEWLFENCSKFRTQEMFNYFLSLEPDYDNVSWLIYLCKAFQTEENFQRYMDMEPFKSDVLWFLEACPPFKIWYEKQQEVV